MLNSSAQSTVIPRTVLVVEDEPTLATAIAQRITAEGWTRLNQSEVPSFTTTAIVQSAASLSDLYCVASNKSALTLTCVSDFVLPLPDPVSTAEHPAAPIIIVNPKTIANNFFAIFLSPFDNLLNISVTGFHLFFGNSHFFTNHHYNYIKKYK